MRYGFILLSCFFYTAAFGHEIRPAYLQITENEVDRYTIIWKIPLKEDVVPKIQFVLPKDFIIEESSRRFLPDAFIRKYSGQFEQPLQGETLSIQGLELTLIDVFVQIDLLDGSSYALLLQPGRASASIPIQPGFWQVMRQYFRTGGEHILSGYDHLLFVIGLLLLLSGFLQVAKAITAFTLAHSLTLGTSLLSTFHLPQAPVETAIALSIVFLAAEVVRVYRGDAPTFTVRFPWMVAFLFGLLHGYGFAGALTEIGLPQKHVPLALFSFNLGIEAGQLAFIGLVLVLSWLRNKFGFSEVQNLRLYLAYAIGGIAAFWVLDRLWFFGG